MAHPDLDNLLNALLPFARQYLARHGAFHPFGAVITAAGELKLTAARDGDEHPPSQRVIDLMTEAHRQHATAREIRAAGICMDSLITPAGSTQKADAIEVRLEHQSGECVTVFVPYKRRFWRRVALGEMIAQRGTLTVFS